MINRVEHVGIIAFDMVKSIDFYKEVLGFEVKVRTRTLDKELVFLTHPGLPEFEVELISDLINTSTYSAQGLVNHLAFSVEDFDDMFEKMKARGIIFEREEPKVGMNNRKTIRFTGPSGEILQLVEARESVEKK